MTDRTPDPTAGTIRTEIAVLGSGPGGAVTACLLAEAGREVLMIEEGPALDAGSPAPFGPEEMLLKYRNGGLTAAFGPSKIAFVEGRVVGGSSEINAGLYHRAPESVLDRWRRDFEVESLTEKDLSPHFEACEREVSAGAGTGAVPEASSAFAAGARELGLRPFEARRMVAGPRGERRTMSRSFIPRFLRAGGRLISDARALRILRGGEGWEIRCLRGSSGEFTVAARTLFVACGAVQTPALLRASGFRGAVGNSLDIHPFAKVVAEFDRPVNAEGMGVGPHQAREEGRGLSYGCSVSTPAHLALALLDRPDAVSLVASGWRNMAAYYASVPGSGGGLVRTLPGRRDPLVRYRLAPGRAALMVSGLRRLTAMLLRAGARRVFPGLPGVAPITDEGQLSRIPEVLPVSQGRLVTTHVFASCPMGERRGLCAADSFGRLHGHKGLHIADASLFCGSPEVNPQGTVMALARRNAEFFLKKSS